MRPLIGIVVASMLLAGLPAYAQVPFVPTPQDVVERMLTLAKVGKDDYVIDLGSGDGRLVRTAASKFGARAFGVDHDQELVARSQVLARKEGVAERASFMVQDLFQTSIADATVVTMYLFPAINLKLRPRLIAELKPGTRVVSHDFDMGEWVPDETVTMYSKEKYGATGGDSTLHLWIVPANVAGRWRWRLEIAGQAQDYELVATQRFQKMQATVRVGGREAVLENAVLRGDRLSFAVVTEIKGRPVRQAFSGRVARDEIEGSVELSGARMHGAADWTAERIERGYLSTGQRATNVVANAR